MNKTIYSKGLELLQLYNSPDHEECSKKCKKIFIREPNSELAVLAQLIYKKIQLNNFNAYNEILLLWQQKNNEIGQAVSDENNTSSAIYKLNNLIGLQNVKEEIIKIQKKLELDKFRKIKLGVDSEMEAMNFVFSGNPGTGKTTVARLLADILKDMGVLSKGQLIEVDRGDLVGSHIGETALKTKDAINNALGGVLFIDEAYSLAHGGSNDFGREAIDTLVKGIEDHRNEMVVILAGYKNDMFELIKANSGLESRFTNYIDFPDYSNDELYEIAKKIASEKKYKFTADGKKAFITRIEKDKVSPKFGNARSVRNIMNEAFMNKARNFDKLQTDERYITQLFAEDFGVSLSDDVAETAQIYVEQLNNMTGLDNVKNEVNSIISMVKYSKLEAELTGRLNTDDYGSLHLCFTGNPGTGKTTVARIYANILKCIGVLKKGEIIEASRNDFVGAYQGHTAKKTQEICEKAYGGVLFIDEAYSLVNDERDTFGHEAVATLIKEMEDNRDKLVVILAGYSREMEQFMYANSGIASRIGKNIEFPDYTYEELCEIFDKYVSEDNISADNTVINKCYELIHNIYNSRNANFGNAREIRKIYEQIKRNMKTRVVSSNITGADIKKLELEDILCT